MLVEGLTPMWSWAGKLGNTVTAALGHLPSKWGPIRRHAPGHMVKSEKGALMDPDCGEAVPQGGRRDTSGHSNDTLEAALPAGGGRQGSWSFQKKGQRHISSVYWDPRSCATSANYWALVSWG